MTNRKKRLAKGIASLKKQIEIHEGKEEKAKEEGMEELNKYYIKEIEAKKRDLQKKEKIFDR